MVWHQQGGGNSARYRLISIDPFWLIPFGFALPDDGIYDTGLLYQKPYKGNERNKGFFLHLKVSILSANGGAEGHLQPDGGRCGSMWGGGQAGNESYDSSRMESHTLSLFTLPEFPMDRCTGNLDHTTNHVEKSGRCVLFNKWKDNQWFSLSLCRSLLSWQLMWCVCDEEAWWTWPIINYWWFG